TLAQLFLTAFLHYFFFYGAGFGGQTLYPAPATPLRLLRPVEPEMRRLKGVRTLPFDCPLQLIFATPVLGARSTINRPTTGPSAPDLAMPLNFPSFSELLSPSPPPPTPHPSFPSLATSSRTLPTLPPTACFPLPPPSQ